MKNHFSLNSIFEQNSLHDKHSFEIHKKVYAQKSKIIKSNFQEFALVAQLYPRFLYDY